MQNTLVAALTVAVAVASTSASADAFRSVTKLSADQEVTGSPAVPANVASDGEARAVIRFEKDFSAARINLRFNNLVGGTVTRLHFHCNVAGQNGPVAIGLIDTLNPGNDNSDVISLVGNRISGTITNADFPGNDATDSAGNPANRCTGPVGFAINNIASLAAAIDAGLVYWNLHTDAFPPGELRGQVRPLVERDD